MMSSIEGNTALATPGETFRFTPGEVLVFRIPERISTADWAAKYRTVVDGGKRSPWRNDLSPCAVGIMDALDKPYIREVYVQAPPQTVKTQTYLNYLMHRIDLGSTSAMLIMPDEKLTKRIFRRRLIRSIKDTARTAAVISPRSDDITQLSISLINGMDITGAWAGSASAVSSDAMEVVILDEMNKYPPPTGAEPDAFVNARNRTNSFPHTYKIYGASTANDENGLLSRTIRARADVTYYYYAKCPICGEEQRMLWENISWGNCKDPREILRNRLARYHCSACGMAWDDSIRDKAVLATMRNGWRPEPDAPLVDRPRVVAFKLQSWYVQSMSEAAAAFVEGQNDKEKLKAWVTQHASEDWKEDIKTKNETGILIHRTSSPPLIVPADAVALTCGIDVQKYSYWFAVRAWAEELTSWLIQYGELQSWSAVEDLLYRTAYRIEGADRTMEIWRACIDTGGGETDDGEWTRTEEIYQWLRNQPPIGFDANGNPIYRVYGTKGASHVDSLHAKRIKVTRIDQMPRSNKPIPGGLELRLLDTFAYKGLIHWRLDRKEGETQRFFLHSETGEDYARQILAEELARDKNKKLYWKKKRADNHLLDCEVGCAAAADPQWLPSLQMLAPYWKREFETRTEEQPKPQQIIRSNWMQR